MDCDGGAVSPSSRWKFGCLEDLLQNQVKCDLHEELTSCCVQLSPLSRSLAAEPHLGVVLLRLGVSHHLHQHLLRHGVGWSSSARLGVPWRQSGSDVGCAVERVRVLFFLLSFSPFGLSSY